MRCASVVYLSMATIFGVACSLPKPCAYEDYKEEVVYCGRDNKYAVDVIPTITRYVRYMVMQGQPLKQLPYNGFRNLSSQGNISIIRLLECQISHVDAGALLNLHNLTRIDLPNNDISRIDSKLFSDTKKIRFINMEHNKIEVVPTGLFQNLMHLEEVSLQHNQIYRVEWLSFKNTPSLRKIDLYNNQIEYMNMLFIDKLDNLSYITLHGNPWRCNCELGPLYEFIIQYDHFVLYGLECGKPSTLHGRNWKEISRDVFLCRSKVAMSAQDSIMTSVEPVTTVVEQGSDRRTNSRHMDWGLPMRDVQSSAGSEDSD